MIDDQIAALEEAAFVFEHQCGFPDKAATLRTLADSLRAGGERAQIVGGSAQDWFERGYMAAFADSIADRRPIPISDDILDRAWERQAIASGAHTEGRP